MKLRIKPLSVFIAEEGCEWIAFKNYQGGRVINVKSKVTG